MLVKADEAAICILMGLKAQTRHSLPKEGLKIQIRGGKADQKCLVERCCDAVCACLHFANLLLTSTYVICFVFNNTTGISDQVFLI